MTAQELKNSILQLAVQGKLVPQDKNDKPASELLKRIQAEKERLIKAGKLKKEKALPPIMEEELPFDIPESWEWIRVGDICTIVTGKKDANFGSETGKYNFFTCAKDPIKCNSYSFSGESLLLAGNGDISNISYFEGYFEAYQRTYVLQPFLPKTYLIYLFYHLQYNWLAYNSDKTFGSAIPYIRLGNVQNYLVALPPLEEQKRIVAKIEELLPLVEEYRKAETRLKELNADFPEMLRKSILQQAVQGKLTERNPEDEPAAKLLKRIQTEKAQLIKDGKIKKEKPLPPITEDEIPFDIPDTWQWVRWGDLSYSIQYGYNAPALSHGRIKMVRISDIQDNKVIWETVPHCDIEETDIASYLLKENDILFARTGGTVGKSFLVQNISEDAIYAGYLIRTQYSSSLVPQYLKFFMESQLYWNQLREGTIATAQPNCNGKTLSKMLLPLPPFEEQKRIVVRVEELLTLCDELR